VPFYANLNPTISSLMSRFSSGFVTATSGIEKRSESASVIVSLLTLQLFWKNVKLRFLISGLLEPVGMPTELTFFGD